MMKKTRSSHGFPHHTHFATLARYKAALKVRAHHQRLILADKFRDVFKNTVPPPDNQVNWFGFPGECADFHGLWQAMTLETLHGNRDNLILLTPTGKIYYLPDLSFG